LANMNEISLIIPAAGSGTRMGGTIPKALVPVNGMTLVEFATLTLMPLCREIIMLVSPSTLDLFKGGLPKIQNIDVQYVVQEIPRGTAEAVQIGLNYADSDFSVIMWADHIGAHFFSPSVLQEFWCSDTWDVVVPVLYREDPYVYFDIDEDGSVVGFNETRMGATKQAFGWSDCGVFLVRNTVIRSALQRLATVAEAEVNFLALFPLLNKMGLRVTTKIVDDHRLTLGANSFEELTMVLNEFGDKETEV
jgi:bifunctional N-acetylglucosamine-1-phosphate-uridyltransferase/glucosamine-1-phosphate-acetyltransferase GlmU-like protein